MWAFNQPQEAPPAQASYGWSLDSNQNTQNNPNNYNQGPGYPSGGMPLMPMPAASYLPPMPSGLDHNYRPAPAREHEVDIPEYQFIMKSAPPSMSGLRYTVSQFG